MTAALTPPVGAAEPAPQGFPSPQDWRDEVVYSILVDRFAHEKFRATHGDPADGDSRHGGNLPGVTASLDYLAELGVTVLQLSPVATNDPSSYHGYGPVHLTEVDPALGTLDDLVELVEQAHRRNMRVVLDLVLNHVARVFDYPDGDAFRAEPAPSVIWSRDVGPTEFADERRYSRRGLIQDWQDDVQAVRGDFPPGLRRLATEDPDTAALLIDIAVRWLDRTDIDGVRVDAVRHLDPEFVRRCCVELRAAAHARGKRNFLVLGEHSTTTDEPLVDTLAAGVDSVYLYPEYRRQSWPLHGRAPASELADSTITARRVIGEHAHDHGARFIDNHDVYRFLRRGEPIGRLHAALAFGLLSTGIPTLYYGTEQGFRQETQRLDRECSADRAAPHNREDMFGDGAFTSSSSAGDRFDTTSPTYRWTRQLIALRAAHPALRRGRQIQRWADPAGPGIYSFSRLLDGAEVLVVINLADEERSGTVPVGSALPDGSCVVDRLEPGVSITVRDGAVSVSLAGHQVRVLVAVGEQRVGHRRREPAGPGELPEVLLTAAVPVVNEGRFAAKAVVGQLLSVSVTVSWHGPVRPEVRARFTGPDATEQLLTLITEPDSDTCVGRLEVTAVGSWSLQFEASVPGTGHWVVDGPWPVFADPLHAAVGGWYSVFPRSTGGRDDDGRPRPGTLATTTALLPHIAALGFDVVHLTPIHPIGHAGRKGRNGARDAGPDDPGSPWAIGDVSGGHDAVHPELGDVEDVRQLVRAASSLGLRVALELVVQCSPDHPWLQTHPEWRGSGSAAAVVAEHGWTDVVALDFDTDPDGIAAAVSAVIDRWIALGVRMFRVDNPHSKPAAFWHRLIWSTKARHPDVVFLAEAFTRPSVQRSLSMLGFSQSLTYFMWRESKEELVAFGRQLQQVSMTLRANLFPTNHDVLPESLRHASPTAFAVRAALAATLAPSWGIPSGFELGENVPEEHGRGWLDSEKFEIRSRDLVLSPDAVLPRTIRYLNAVRRMHPALQQVGSLEFLDVDDPSLIAYRRHDESTGEIVLCVVTLDAQAARNGRVAVGPSTGWVELDTGSPVEVVEGRLAVTVDPARNVIRLFTTTQPTTQRGDLR